LQKISIIQGRLSPRPFPKLQAFPSDTWEEEFNIAKELDFYSIEWIFEINNFKRNPIWSQIGRSQIKEIIATSGVPVKSVCADYFLESPFFRVPDDVRKRNISILMDLIRFSSDIGVKSILLPVLETAEIKNDEERKLLLDAIWQCVPLIEKHDIRICFETELPAVEYLSLVSALNSPYIGAYYDSGNCAAKGFDMSSDVAVLGDKLFNVHIKDRPVNGVSTYLGEGATNFNEAIPILIKNDYKGLLVLQSYFGEDYIGDAIRNKKYINDIIERVTV